ncbi:MAG: hypothetical protein V3W32_04115 [Gemmatimonadota bacterium]
MQLHIQPIDDAAYQGLVDQLCDGLARLIDLTEERKEVASDYAAKIKATKKDVVEIRQALIIQKAARAGMAAGAR